MILNPDIEYIVHCSEEGKTIGPISRKHAHIPEVRKILCHKTVGAMVYNLKTHQWGIQQKLSKATGKTMWDISVGGHCTYEEIDDNYQEISFEETLKKESFEEIGKSIKINDSLSSETGFILDTQLYKNSYNNEFLALGVIFTDNTIIEPQDGEVLNFKWMTSKELYQFMEKEVITDTLKDFFPAIEEKVQEKLSEL